MAYIKIILGLLVWGVLFFYGGSAWLDSKREQTCTSEVNKDEPNLEVVNERCLQTADHFMLDKNYGSASWFYLLAGEYEKNVDEVEAKITDEFYMNIGHSYMLKGDYEKAKEIYTNYPWAKNEDFHYVDETIQPDFLILPKLYEDKKENIAKGLTIWNEIYEPIGKIVQASNAYSMAEEAGDNSKQIEHLEEYLKYAIPYKDKKSIEFISRKKELATLYSYESREKESIDIYKELLLVYENNKSKEFDCIDTLLTIAGKYRYLPDYNATIEYYEHALAISLDSNSTEEIPLSINNIYTNIADTYKKMNKNKKALDYYLKTLKYIEEKDAKNYNNLSIAYSNMAEIYYSQKDYNLSIENYTKSIELKKEELKDSEDYYREYIFLNLQELYSNLSDNYRDLNMKSKANEINREYISFLEYEYETHYKLIAISYDKLAKSETDASIRVETELKAIKYSKRSVETELDSIQEENNEELYKYMNNLKEYIYAVDGNKTKGNKAYLKYIVSFEEFQEEVFLGENNNTALLAKSYNFISDAYKITDLNKSRIYAEKAVDFIKNSIDNYDNEDEKILNKNSSYAYYLDTYSYDLWDIYHNSKLDVNSSIDEYYKFKKNHYKEGSAELISAFETIGKFSLNHKLVDDAIVNYKKALNEATVNSENSYLIYKNINKLQHIYMNRENIKREKAMKLMSKLILWQEKRYDEKLLLAKSYMSLADIYSENNNTNMVMSEYNKSIEICHNYIEENNNSLDGLYILRNVYEKVSIYYVEHNEKEKAIASMNKLIDYTEKIFPEHKEENSNNYELFSNIYKLMNDEENSKKYQEKSLELISNLKSTDVVYEPL